MKILCSICKIETENLMKLSVTTSGNQRYCCRKCNTEKSKKYRHLKGGDVKARESFKKARLEHPEKFNARCAVAYNVRVGHIIKPNQCSTCGKNVKIEAHHNDYSKRLDVKWLCRVCHQDLHKKLAN